METTKADFIITAEHMPGDFEAPGGNAWAEFYLETDSTRRARALRIDGSFELKESGDGEGREVDDGWLIYEPGLPKPVFALTHEEFTSAWRPLDTATATATATAHERLEGAWHEADRYKMGAERTSNKAAARELALVKTHIEDAQMRLNRGLAILSGTYAPADVEVLQRDKLAEY